MKMSKVPKYDYKNEEEFERVKNNLDYEGECWIWRGPFNHKNVPVIKFKKESKDGQSVLQIMGFREFGENRKDYRRSCQRYECVNPKHLISRKIVKLETDNIEEILKELNKYIIKLESGCHYWRASQWNSKQYFAKPDFILNSKFHKVVNYLNKIQNNLENEPELLNECGNKSCVNPKHFKEFNNELIHIGLRSEKFTPEDCRKIIEMKKEGKTYKQICEYFNYPFRYYWYIWNVVHGKRFKKALGIKDGRTAL